MRRECFNSSTLFLLTLLLVSCSRETAVAPPAASEPGSVPPVASASPTITQTQTISTTYGGALDWLRSAPAFSFVLKEAGIEAEGEVRRERIGAERVQFKAGGEEWRAASSPQGVTWEKRGAGGWSSAEAPPFGNRVYQRVTLAFDPQKKEGEAQLVGSDDAVNQYRFTDANTGELHDVWVSRVTGHPERMTIGETVELRLAPLAAD